MGTVQRVPTLGADVLLDLIQGAQGTLGAEPLTPRELEICCQLLEGNCARDIAVTRNRSVETVRTQVKTILAKFAARSVPELLARIYGFGVRDLTAARGNRDRLGGVGRS